MRRIITLTLLLFSTLSVFGQDYKYINADVLNIREGAGTQYKVVGQSIRGEKIVVISESKGWTQIETQNGVKGYVATKYLSLNSKNGVSPKEDEVNWVGLIIVLVIFGFATYKLKNLFVWIFGGSTSTSPRHSKNTSYSSSKVSAKPIVVSRVNYYCKCCGAKFTNVRDLTSNPCFDSETKKHQLFEGKESSTYFCKCCGRDFPNLKDLTLNGCISSPTERHQPYEGSLKSKYACKHCGKEYTKLIDLTSNGCIKSPTQRHQPAN